MLFRLTRDTTAAGSLRPCFSPLTFVVLVLLPRLSRAATSTVFTHLLGFDGPLSFYPEAG